MKKFESLGLGVIMLYQVLVIAGIIGWIMNLFHCIAYIGGGNVDDSTAELVVRVVGVFLFIPGAIAGYF